MKTILFTALLSATLFSQATAQDAALFPRGEISTTDNHTGTVWLAELGVPDSIFNYSLAQATFAPGAKLDWHIHPAGQYLLITEGTGYYQEKGKSIQIVRKGDVVKCLPGVEHWHGATPQSSFAYIGATPAQKGKTIWTKRVTDKEYNSIIAQQNLNTTNFLDLKQQTLITISALAGKGELTPLHTAMNEGLNAGWTISELKEAMVQVYAYAGFPRSLNALTTLQTVINERKQRGMKDVLGREPTPLLTNKTKLQTGTELQTKLLGSPAKTSVADFAPIIDIFLKEHLFGDIFGRDILDFKTREFVTISTLAGLGNAEAQLRSHISVSMYNGITEAQLNNWAAVIQNKIGAKEGRATNELVQAVLQQQSNTSTNTVVTGKVKANGQIKNEMIIRISEIEIYSKDLEAYKAILKEEAEASVRLEPGVISIFPMYKKVDSTQVKILEIYANRNAYESHLKTPHFQRYKTTTLNMVKSLQLIDMDTIDAATMPTIFSKLMK